MCIINNTKMDCYYKWLWNVCIWYMCRQQYWIQWYANFLRASWYAGSVKFPCITCSSTCRFLSTSFNQLLVTLLFFSSRTDDNSSLLTKRWASSGTIAANSDLLQPSSLSYIPILTASFANMGFTSSTISIAFVLPMRCGRKWVQYSDPYRCIDL